MSKLFLVGAGPGDPELITLKAVRALQHADVVLYDALANEELLAHCNPNCELVFVGKRAGIHQYQQIYINDMIVHYGKLYQNVVRLKGGDPFVFGRGHEELEHARSHKMEVEIVPGISSSVSVPALSEIPVTKRGCSESFWVITGTTKTLELSNDIQLAAKSSATVIILMGMNHLDKIVNTFSDARGRNEAIGIIQNGSTTKEKSAFGEMGNISGLVADKGLSSPAIIVIGEVVRHGREQVEAAVAEELVRFVA